MHTRSVQVATTCAFSLGETCSLHNHVKQTLQSWNQRKLIIYRNHVLNKPDIERRLRILSKADSLMAFLIFKKEQQFLLRCLPSVVTLWQDLFMLQLLYSNRIDQRDNVVTLANIKLKLQRNRISVVLCRNMKCLKVNNYQMWIYPWP